MTRYLKPIVAAVAVTVTYSLPLWADGDNLPMLYEDLANADAAGSVGIVREIKLEWSRSGSVSMDLLLKRGRDALERGEAQVAIEHFTALTDHAPDFAEGFHGRARAYYAAEMWGPALADLERALAIDPHHYEAIFGLGAILEQLDRVEEAVAVYHLALKVYPHYEDAQKAVDRLASRVEGQTL